VSLERDRLGLGDRDRLSTGDLDLLTGGERDRFRPAESPKSSKDRSPPQEGVSLIFGFGRALLAFLLPVVLAFPEGLSLNSLSSLKSSSED